MMDFNKEYFVNTLESILEIDSPTGFTGKVIQKIKEIISNIDYDSYLTNKGNLIVNIPGESDINIGISAHIDTLGLMVRSINSDGTLVFTKIGGAILPTLDGEYCKIYTRDGRTYTGTILSNSPAVHVFEDANDRRRDAKNMNVKLDNIVSNEDDVKKLGIQTGDFICYDPKTVITPEGFIKSRFLDDKMSASIVISLLKYFKDNNITPKHNLKVCFSTYEEVGHGLAHLPEGLDEVLALDMGCIGDDLNCTEYDVSICAKDSSGPYDYNLTSYLINLAKTAGLDYAVDIYPMYGSDVSAAQAAGHDIRGALIGPGVAASHGMERSHMRAAENTWKLLFLYLTK